MLKKATIIITVLSLLLLAACGRASGSSSNSIGAANQTLVIGTTPAQADLWQFIKKQAAHKGVTLQIKLLTGQADLNSMLLNGDVDANSFQHIAFLTSWNQIHHANIIPVGTTIIAPLGLYSKKVKSLKELKNGDKIAIPNDSTNLSRSLILLENAGLIKLKTNLKRPPLVQDITSNPHHYQIITAESAMLPRSLDDVTIAAIINQTALNAGYTLKQSLYHENQQETKYVNVIATTETKARSKKKALQILNEVYHSKAVADYIAKRYKGNFVPVTRSIADVKAAFKKEQQNQ
ncbi:MetQ/NlpA family ABC transporter substrate-binding protein [Sporolactobacillus sp. KGMB 08714]|uniref:MetQ/NlpA family ABC transporter substrate-binding protein n=1 Tax=Sporolactobacillus sp. KGMB 08714 TaxID=3064704 RepID=UPI002FBDC958